MGRPVREGCAMSASAVSRTELLALASQVASGIEANSTNEQWSPDDVAERALLVVEAILARIEDEAAQ